MSAEIKKTKPREAASESSRNEIGSRESLRMERLKDPKESSRPLGDREIRRDFRTATDGKMTAVDAMRRGTGNQIAVNSDGQPTHWRQGFRGADGSFVPTDKKPTFHSNEGPLPGGVPNQGLDAGHTNAKEEKQRLAYELPELNRNTVKERMSHGSVPKEVVVDCKSGIPFEKQTADRLKDKGLLGATSHGEGWTQDDCSSSKAGFKRSKKDIG